jgi:hypothetical protein
VRSLPSTMPFFRMIVQPIATGRQNADCTEIDKALDSGDCLQDVWSWHELTSDLRHANPELGNFRSHFSSFG